jgi:N4-gp56 family major capsid protein
MEKTLENMTGFTKVQDYGGREMLDPVYEIGAMGRFRFIVNPILTYLPDHGAVTGSWTGSGTTGKSDAGTKINVYPMIIMGKGKDSGEAFGQVALRGMDSVKATHIPVGERSKSDPLGQRGYVGGITWQAQAILNDSWMAVYYVGTEA